MRCSTALMRRLPPGLLTGGEGGPESHVFQLAQSIGTDQQGEISRMKSVLAEIAAG